MRDIAHVMKRAALIWLAIIVPLWLVLALCTYWEPIIRDGWGFLSFHRKYGLTWTTAEAFMKNNYNANNPRLGQLYTLVMYTSGPWHVIVTPLVELALFYVLATLALGRWPSLRRADDALGFMTIVAMVFATARSLGPLLFYRPFMGNYTVGLLMNLLWLVPYRLHAETRCMRWWWTPVMFVLGVVSGLCNEHTGPALLAAGLFALVVYWRRGERIVPWAWAGIIGMAIGMVVLLGAPGQAVRYAGAASRQSILDAVIHRGVGGAAWVVLALPLFLTPLLLWLVPVLVARRRGSRSEQPRSHVVAALVALAMATLMVFTLLGSPRWGDRLYFASICLACAAAASWVCAHQGTLARRSTLAVNIAALVVVSAILLFTHHRLHDEFTARFAILEHATPGTVVRVPTYSQERSRYVLGDDFLVPTLRGSVAKAYQLQDIQLDQRVPTTAPSDEP